MQCTQTLLLDVLSTRKKTGPLTLIEWIVKAYEYTVNARFTQGLMQLLSFVKKHLNEHIMYYNFSFLIEKSFRNLTGLLHSLTHL